MLLFGAPVTNALPATKIINDKVGISKNILG